MVSAHLLFFFRMMEETGEQKNKGHKDNELFILEKCIYIDALKSSVINIQFNKTITKNKL